MKKYLFFLTLGIASFLMVNAQKENGTVYSEHEAIGKTRAMWDAFVKGDKATCMSFLSDTVNWFQNGVSNKVLKENIAGNIDWWQKVSNLSIKDDTPVFPDAIQYKNGDLWVQDWLRITGTHKASGINFDTPMHDIYGFNKDGKINTLVQYMDLDILKEISNSERTIENGTVYINHPYITTVRKLVNAYCAEDIATMAGIYDPKAMFWSSTGKLNDFINLEAKTKLNKETFADNDNIKLAQVGYPDCIHYAKDDNFVVYSWWVLSCTTKEGKKLKGIPVMLSDEFNKEGKITREYLYISGTHLQ